MGSEKVKCPNCGKTNNIPAAGEGKTSLRQLPRAAALDRRGGETVTSRRSSKNPRCLCSWICGRRGAARVAWSAPRSSSSPENTPARSSWSRSTSMLHPGRLNDSPSAPCPTLLVMDRGEVLARQSGAAPVPQLRTWLDQALSENAGEEAKS